MKLNAETTGQNAGGKEMSVKYKKLRKLQNIWKLIQIKKGTTLYLKCTEKKEK